MYRALIIPRLRGYLGLASHALLGRCCQTNAAVGRRCCSRAQMSRKSGTNPAWQQSSFTTPSTLICLAALAMMSVMANYVVNPQKTAIGARARRLKLGG